MTAGSRWRRWRADALAGLVNAVVSVPDGLAAGALAGVNPVYGLYASIAAPIGGSLAVSAKLMQIATTSASALVAGKAIANQPEETRGAAMFLLVVLTGLILGLFGLLRLGRMSRFVSHAVMTGFLTGVAVVLILDQLAPLVGFSPRGANELTQLWDLLSNPARFSGKTILAGVLALGLAIGLTRTRVAKVASVVALVVPSLLVAVTGWDEVQRVADVSPIPRGVPTPALPDLSLLTTDLVLSAFALAVVIAVQGAGVSESVENPDGSRIDASRDLVAQGAANVASGLLSGIPVGGSVGQTALNVSVGARSRWAGVLSGVFVLGFVVLAPGLLGAVPMAVLGALMIAAGLSAIDLREARSIWNTGGAARAAVVVTFAATLVMPLQLAVATGVVLTAVLHLASAARDITVRALVPLGGGRFREGEPPRRLPSEAVTVIDVHGSLFFAGAHTLEETLPSPEGATRPVVVLRLRGRTHVGATLIDVLDDYADALATAGGRLYLSGVDGDVAAQLRRAGKLDLDRAVRLVPASAVLGASTGHAVESASAWLGRAR